jgi:hypothetical protein
MKTTKQEPESFYHEPEMKSFFHGAPLDRYCELRESDSYKDLVNIQQWQEQHYSKDIAYVTLMNVELMIEITRN